MTEGLAIGNLEVTFVMKCMNDKEVKSSAVIVALLNTIEL